MAILKEKNFIGGGIIKELEESAHELILQNLQEDHYQYPEKAFIRETASNSVDSLDEKHTALSILSGETSVEDHYSSEIDKLSQDSKFDPSYYNERFLNPDDEIIITYINCNTGRDRIEITDTGVGLGGKRLQGYMRPAYSSKRLNKKALGKYGIGAKAGLATGVESYQIMSRHNGREFHFDIYSDRYFSTTSKFADDGTLNPHEIWKVKKRDAEGKAVEVGEKVYYTVTDKYNCLTTYVDVKNPIRRKNTYFEAIKTQLPYFDNVIVKEVLLDGDIRYHDVKAEILYRDDYIIIPKEKYYTTPHIVLNNVIYGPADYAEMELSIPQCSIGMILDPSVVDTNHSRESVRWTDKTRQSIMDFDSKVKDIAFKYLADSVSHANNNFISWLKVCKDIRLNQNSNNTVINRLSGMVDTSLYDFEFPNTGGLLKFSIGGFKTMFRGFSITKTIVNESNGVFTTATTMVKDWSDLSARNLFFRSSTEVSIKSIKMGFITKNHVEGNTVYLMTPNTDHLIGLSFGELDRTKARMSELKRVVNEANDGLMYDDILPDPEFLEEYAARHKKKEEKEEEDKRVASMTAAEIRKRDGVLLIHKLISKYGFDVEDVEGYGLSRDSIKLEDVPNLYSKEDTIYFHKNDMPLVLACLDIFNSKYDGKWTKFSFGDDNLKLIMVAKDSAKFVKMHATHIKEAIQDLTDNTLTVMNPVKKYITCRTFRDKINTVDYRFLRMFRGIDALAFDVYSTLIGVVEDASNFNPFNTHFDGAPQVNAYFDNLVDFQTQIASGASDKDISSLAKTLFGNDAITGCQAMDICKYAEFKALEDFIDPIKGLLRGADLAQVDTASLTEYLKFKGVSSFEEYLKDRYNEFNVPQEDRVV